MAPWDGNCWVSKSFHLFFFFFFNFPSLAWTLIIHCLIFSDWDFCLSWLGGEVFLGETMRKFVHMWKYEMLKEFFFLIWIVSKNFFCIPFCCSREKNGRWPQKKEFFRLMATDKFRREEIEHDLPSEVKEAKSWNGTKIPRFDSKWFFWRSQRSFLLATSFTEWTKIDLTLFLQMEDRNTQNKEAIPLTCLI